MRFIHCPPDSDPSQPDQAPLNKEWLNLKRLISIWRRWKRTSFKDISFAAQPGEIVAILGRTIREINFNEFNSTTL